MLETLGWITTTTKINSEVIFISSNYNNKGRLDAKLALLQQLPNGI
jgi:hypothetical protein